MKITTKCNWACLQREVERRHCPKTAGLESTQPSHMEEKNRRDRRDYHSSLTHSDLPTHEHASAIIHYLINLINMLASWGEERREPEACLSPCKIMTQATTFHQVTQALRSLALLQLRIQLNHCTCFLRVGLSPSVLFIWNSDTFPGNVFEGDKWTNGTYVLRTKHSKLLLNASGDVDAVGSYHEILFQMTRLGSVFWKWEEGCSYWDQWETSCPLRERQVSIGNLRQIMRVYTKATTLGGGEYCVVWAKI